MPICEYARPRNESSLIEIRIQHSYRCNGIHRQVVALCRSANGFGRGSVIDAERFLLIWRDVGMYPGHSIYGIVADNCQADLRAFIGHRYGEAIRKCTFD